MSFLNLDSTTLLAIFSGALVLVLVAFAAIEIALSRSVAKSGDRLAKAIAQLQKTSLVIDEHTSSLTEATRVFSSSVQSLSLGTQALARIESEPKLEYVQRKKDLKLGGIEFDLTNNGKGTAHSVKVTPQSAKGVRLGVSFLNIQRSEIAVGEARRYLLTSVKQGDLISLTVEYKDDIGGACTPQTFVVDAE